MTLFSEHTVLWNRKNRKRVGSIPIDGERRCMANELLEVESSYYVLGIVREKGSYKSITIKQFAIHYFYN